MIAGRTPSRPPLSAAVSSVVPPLPAGTPGCSISFGGQLRSFQVCRKEAAGLTYRWNNLGGNKVEVAASCEYDGWCGLGIGRKMVGSSAIVAFPTGGQAVALEEASKNVCFLSPLHTGQDDQGCAACCLPIVVLVALGRQGKHSRSAW